MKGSLALSRRSLCRRLAVLLVAGAAIPSGAVAGSMPTKIAVFDFELDDRSAGAGIAGDAAADAARLGAVTSEVRRLLAQSGRYVLVDVSKADGAAVRDHSLAQCDGCEAAIARQLGADQSLLGVVTRISRTEYVVRFQIRDAGSGDVILARQSGLHIGADYSWNRGAAALIKETLLDKP